MMPILAINILVNDFKKSCGFNSCKRIKRNLKLGGKTINFLLIYPQSNYSYVDTRKNNDTFRGLAPPLGLLYIAKILEKEGDNVTILDFSCEAFEEQKLIILDQVRGRLFVHMLLLCLRDRMHHDLRLLLHQYLHHKMLLEAI